MSTYLAIIRIRREDEPPAEADIPYFQVHVCGHGETPVRAWHAALDALATIPGKRDGIRTIDLHAQAKGAKP